MRRLARWRWSRWWLALSVSMVGLLCSLPAVHAQTWRGTYCIRWDQTLTPTRVVWSTHLRGGQTYQVTLPAPTTDNSVQWLALSWGTDMNMPDTVCTWRVVLASEARVLQPPQSAQLWEVQLIEVDTIEVGPGIQPRAPDPRELVVPASVQRSLTWALRGDLIIWLIAIPLGAYLGREWIWAIQRMVRGWFETAQSGDAEWERYNAERGIYYDEDEGEFKRIDDHRA